MPLIRSPLVSFITSLSGSLWLAACGGGGSSSRAPTSPASGALTAERVRDDAINTMRRIDLRGGWTGTENWENRACDTWNQYLTKRIGNSTT